jgi:hypothetical protein
MPLYVASFPLAPATPSHSRAQGPSRTPLPSTPTSTNRPRRRSTSRFLSAPFSHSFPSLIRVGQFLLFLVAFFLLAPVTPSHSRAQGTLVPAPRASPALCSTACARWSGASHAFFLSPTARSLGFVGFSAATPRHERAPLSSVSTSTSLRRRRASRFLCVPFFPSLTRVRSSTCRGGPVHLKDAAASASADVNTRHPRLLGCVLHCFCAFFPFFPLAH